MENKRHPGKCRDWFGYSLHNRCECAIAALTEETSQADLRAMISRFSRHDLQTFDVALERCKAHEAATAAAAERYGADAIVRARAVEEAAAADRASAADRAAGRLPRPWPGWPPNGMDASASSSADSSKPGLFLREIMNQMNALRIQVGELQQRVTLLERGESSGAGPAAATSPADDGARDADPCGSSSWAAWAPALPAADGPPKAASAADVSVLELRPLRGPVRGAAEEF